MNTPRIGKFLDASTDTLTARDMEILEQHQEEHGDVERSVDLPRIVPHRFGWWINVQWNEREQLAADRQRLALNMSRRFQDLFDLAVAKKCDWINLDRDA